MPASAPTRILIAAHTRALAETLADTLAPAGHAITLLEEPTAADLAAALPARVAAEKPALLLLELKQTADALAQLRFHDKHTPVVIMLTSARPEVAFTAKALGAEDMLLMSHSDEEVAATVARVLAADRAGAIPAAHTAVAPVEDHKRRAYDAPITGPGGEHALFGLHPHMAEIRDSIAKVATTSVTVLVRGESGVGKEIVARMIFERSPRAGKPFIKVNCAAIPHDLLESELFGYEAGAFTGATKAKPGKFELAHTGTLFLDEIAEMSPALQAKLLHVLQDGEFARLGAKQDIKVDVRLVCATNKLLEQRVAEGLFREDLFYRINVVTMHIPPLRERPRRDHVPLIRYFLDKYATRNTASRRQHSPPRPKWRCSTTPGPATSASWRTSANASSSSAARPRSSARWPRTLKTPAPRHAHRQHNPQFQLRHRNLPLRPHPPLSRPAMENPSRSVSTRSSKLKLSPSAALWKRPAGTAKKPPAACR